MDSCGCADTLLQIARPLTCASDRLLEVESLTLRDVHVLRGPRVAVSCMQVDDGPKGR